MSLRKITVLALLLSLFVTSCAASADTKVSAEGLDDGTYTWTAALYDFDVSIANDSVTVYGDSIYFASITPDKPLMIYSGDASPNEVYSDIYRWEIGSDEPEKLDFKGSNMRFHYNLVKIQPDGLGNVYIALNNMLSKFDAAGSEIFFEHFTDSSSYIPSSTAVDADGRLYILGGGKLFIIDPDGTVLKEISTDAASILNGADGKVYCISSEGGVLNIYSVDSSGGTSKAYENCISNNLKPYSDGQFLYTYFESVYAYNGINQSTGELLKWSSIGIDQGKVRNLFTAGENTILALLGDPMDIYSSEIAVISLQEAGEITTISLGTITAKSSLTLKVAEFNAASPNCRVELKQYYDPFLDKTIDNSGYQEAITKFHLDIASGNCPDILCLDYDELETYAQKELLEDLTAYFNDSGITLPDNIVTSYTINGALSAVPPMIQIRTMATSGDFANGKDGWTLEEMMALVQNSSSDTPVFDASADKLLEYCLKFNLSSFFSLQDYTCDFENDDFYRILDFCKRCGTGTNVFSADIDINMSQNHALVYEVLIRDPTDYIKIQQYLKSEDIVFIGFPTDSGSGSVIEDIYGSLSVSSVSDKKEAAWGFIEYTLSSELPAYSLYYFNIGFPTCAETRSKYFETVTEEVSYGEDGVREHSWQLHSQKSDNLVIHTYPPSPEEFSPISDLLEASAVPKGYDSTVMDIVLENAQDYFGGEKTAEEVAKQIQSRVMIYLGEIK